MPLDREQLAGDALHVLADRRRRVGEDERHALVVRLDDEHAVARRRGAPAPGRAPARGPRVDAARRVGPVDEVADLRRRVADHPERVGDGDRVVDRRRVVRDDLDDRVRQVEEREVDVVQHRRHVDHDRAVDPAEERQDLVDVAGRDHLGHLDPRRGEQDVDPRRVAPEDVLEVRFGDAVGRQVEDRGRVDRHLEQRPQVAELEAAVDQHRPLARPGRWRPRG